MGPPVYFQSMSGIEQHVDWSAPKQPAPERAGARARTEAAPIPRRDVMATLLGENKLAAFDASGGDPYNATGRHFRR
jgi:hypothetical protein